ncbi:conjugal transfer protein TraW [Neisseria sp. N95_16]|uniref:Conjugal transfer protein TraW n=1 Tax=Neisseria brasiliensis TaxID=2666100 RepID=A0A7X2KZJ8_9NEIS|nr:MULTISPECIES: conjugal transfer protein TraW [Neisseria]MRN39288.1 conjugal transfer protein TraW [Neisseria brasiliensis]PJO09198.1 conjugal transfer protein TraW [Neisseria sp. N95_16]
MKLKKALIVSAGLLVLSALGAGSLIAANNNSNFSEKIGPTYPIAEKHAIREIQTRLKERQDSGELERMQREVQERINRSALNLAPVEGLETAEKSSVRYFEPSYTLPENIYDHENRIIATAGTVIKPLEVAPIPFKMFFFDGREPAQVDLAAKLAKEHGEAFMPILTAGDWYELSARMNQAVYYDQQGKMSRSFQLSEVPSLVSQEGQRLRIEAMKP